MQSVLPAVYPILKTAYRLDFGQIGLITFANQATASLLQPVIGNFTDRSPRPYSLPTGMAFTLVGLLLLSVAPTYGVILLAVAMVGIGSSVFHPESSRVARLASGGRHGFAQSLFQVGGNIGSSTGPLLAAYIVQPYGQRSIAWFGVAALSAMAILLQVSNWYRHRLLELVKAKGAAIRAGLPTGRVRLALIVLVLLVFSKNIYLASLTSYYTFYLIGKFHLSVQSAQLHLFVLARIGRGGHVHRRAGWRPHRAQVRDLGFDPRRAAVHAAAALRESVLDRDPDRDHRPDSRVGVLRHRRLCAGTGARAAWAPLPACSSALRSAPAASARRCSVSSPTRRASTPSSRSARSCRRSGCSPGSFPTSNRRGTRATDSRRNSVKGSDPTPPYLGGSRLLDFARLQRYTRPAVSRSKLMSKVP